MTTLYHSIAIHNVLLCAHHHS